ncbi:class I SAM-dependent methyltransferase [Microcystis aeruginosa]|jgi:ubiquinone/menaquinone biosynthesis C-methylase UbiE|uniref:Methyltransferase domain-containing protein n=1 Tax=Microcystis aeruginosa FD4 TaxID=2686288 RepID=A0A857D0S9_MICAE|nr:class I SAM-dependent methyltransferase [Microcystis aeruginosa]NCR09499.1 class I SAM-dependent methyltransferase [Microcystis aeruginosa LG13-11]QGZ89234.1 methyltransferase domain-containing protein [Microcystis aeruginosa FD4]
MKFTGERFIPSEKGVIRYEHLHRYMAIIDYVKDKSVIDIACGEGYGSSIMSAFAKNVSGIDISPECIANAQSKYQRENLTFLQGYCNQIPVNSRSVDVVVSFETIEHHDQHEEMLAEIKRILKPEGILIMSSPNRVTYSDIPNNHNPFHVKELYYEELKILLDNNFKNVQFYGQKILINSAIIPLNSSLDALEKIRFYPQNNQFHDENSEFKMENPIYFLAICSDENLNNLNIVSSIYIDSQADIYQDLQKTYKEFSQVYADLQDIKNSNFGKMRELWMKFKSFLATS